MAVEVVLLLFSQHEPEVAWKYENFVRLDDLNLANAGIFKALIFLNKHIIVTRFVMIIFLIVTNLAKIVTNLTNIVTWFVLTDDWLLVVARHVMPLDTCADFEED